MLHSARRMWSGSYFSCTRTSRKTTSSRRHRAAADGGDQEQKEATSCLAKHHRRAAGLAAGAMGSSEMSGSLAMTADADAEALNKQKPCHDCWPPPTVARKRPWSGRVQIAAAEIKTKRRSARSPPKDRTTGSDQSCPFPPRGQKPQQAKV